MAKIELWWKVGTGIFKFMREHSAPMFVVVLEDRNGNLFPIHENNNEVPSGNYHIRGLCPYEKEDKRILDLGAAYINHNAQTVYIVVEHLMGLMSCYCYEDEKGEQYIRERADKIRRPYGWREDTVERMLFDYQS